MQEKYDLNDVEESFTKFEDLVSDLLNSDYSTFDATLRTGEPGTLPEIFGILKIKNCF